MPKVRLYVATGGVADAVPEACVRRKARDGISEGRDVPRRNQEACFAVVNDLCGAAHRGGYDWAPGDASLQQGVR